MKRRRLDISPVVSDEVKTTTCYMCACRCGIKVHLRDGSIRYIEGNRDHPVNRGVLCAKGSAGIMQHYSPARLTRPLKRVGERGACGGGDITIVLSEVSSPGTTISARQIAATSVALR